MLPELPGVFWIGLLAGGFIASGGLTVILLGALTERLRSKFLGREEGATKLEMEARDEDRRRHWEELMEKLEHRLREQMQSVIGTLDIRIMQRHEALQRDLDRMLKAQEKSSELAFQAERQSREAHFLAKTANEKVEALERQLDARLGTIQVLLEQGRDQRKSS